MDVIAEDRTYVSVY